MVQDAKFEDVVKAVEKGEPVDEVVERVLVEQETKAQTGDFKDVYEYGYDHGYEAGVQNRGDEDEPGEIFSAIRENWAQTAWFANVVGPMIRDRAKEVAEEQGEDEDAAEWMKSEAWDAFNEGAYAGFVAGFGGDE